VRPSLGLAAIQGYRARRLEVSRRQCPDEALRRRGVCAEADHHQPGAGHALEHQRPGGEQQVYALGDDELADEADDRLALGPQRRQRERGAQRIEGERRRRRLAGRQLGRGPPRLDPLDQGVQACGGFGRRSGPEDVHVDAGRPEPGAAR
jgi:hypothetical protein